ncbi:MAG: hypothetical protein LBI06_01155 [Treponema sp.]|jgi:hypothetical protein|nr:hypothetical protein [Treponema sp.]
MAVKTRKDSIYVIYEGYREGYFLEHLERQSDVRLNSQFCSGGSSNQIVLGGIKHSDRNVNVYIIFDEDFETKPDQKISDETLEYLAKKWKLNQNDLKRCPYKQLQAMNTGERSPLLVISHPQSIEGFLLRLLDSHQKDTLERKTTKQLKDMIESILNNVRPQNEDAHQIQSYDEKIAKYREEIAKQKQSEPNYREHRRFLESKIADYERKKNKVTFMRFLSKELPLPVMAAKRSGIPEIDILLKAFGL